MPSGPAENNSDEEAGSLSPLILVSCLGLVVLGLVVRIVLLRSRLGPPDTDESVVLLMAKDMLHGHFVTFYWGQEYGGSQEALLVAGVALIGVPLRWAGEMVTIGLSAVAAGLLWRLARSSSLGTNVGLLSGSLYWSAPILYVWLSQKERGFYESSLVSCLAALLFTTRYLRSSRIIDAVGIGLAVGSAIWASPQSLYLLVPIGLWLLGHVIWTRSWNLLRGAPFAAAAIVAGAAPWLWTNAHTGFGSLVSPEVPVTTAGQRLSLYWRQAMPQVSGLKMPYDPLRWIGTRALLVPHVGLVLLVLLGAVMLARKTPWVPLALAWHPIMFVALGTSFYVLEARYLSLLWPTSALALAYATIRFGRSFAGAALALFCGVLCAVGCLLLISFGTSNTGFFDLVPPQASKVLDAMDRLGVDRAYAEYWTSYTLEVASGGDVIASPLDTIRDPRRERLVGSADRVGYVLYTGGCSEMALNAVAASLGQAPPERLEAGERFAVVVPERRIPPQDIVRVWAKKRGSDREDLPDCAT